MNHWKTAMLGDLVEPADTWNPAKAASDEVFDYIDLSAVDQEAKLIRGTQRIVGAEAPSRARQLVAKGDVLVSTVRPNLNGVAKVPEELDGATASTGFCILRARSTVLDRSYLFHWVKSPDFVGDMVRKATGASYPAVSDRIIFESRLPIPPVSEQERIAEVLDRAEALRAKRRAVLAQLDTLTQSIFLDLFGDPATNPKGWPMRKLEEVSELENGDRSANYPSGDEIKDEGILFLSTKNIVDDALDLSEAVFISEAKFRSLSRGKARRKDLIITLRGTLGSCCIFDCKYATAFINAQMMIIRPKVDGTEKYLHALMTSRRTKDHFARVGYGAAVRQLSSSLLSQLAIPFPDVALQREFARRVAAVEQLKAGHRASLAKLDALFAVLQHRAFRGEL